MTAARLFKQSLPVLVQVAESLLVSNPENPCAYVFSTPKTKKKKNGLPDKEIDFEGVFVPDSSTFDAPKSDIDQEGEGSCDSTVTP